LCFKPLKKRARFAAGQRLNQSGRTRTPQEPDPLRLSGWNCSFPRDRTGKTGWIPGPGHPAAHPPLEENQPVFGVTHP